MKFPQPEFPGILSKLEELKLFNLNFLKKLLIFLAMNLDALKFLSLSLISFHLHLSFLFIKTGWSKFLSFFHIDASSKISDKSKVTKIFFASLLLFLNFLS